MSIITDLSLRWLYRLTDLTHIKCFLVAQLVKNHLQCRRPWFDSWAGKIFCRRDRLPIPGFSGLPGRSDIEESTYNAGDLGSIPELGRFPWRGNGYPLQYSGPENPMDCLVHGVAKSQTRLSVTFTFRKRSSRSVERRTIQTLHLYLS